MKVWTLVLLGLALTSCSKAPAETPAATQPAEGAATRPATQTTSQPALTQAERQKLNRLIADLESKDAKTLDEAFGSLASMDAKAAGAIDVLVEMLNDGRRITYRNHRYRSLNRTFQVNVSAVGVLWRIGKPAVEALIGGLKNSDERVRQLAAQYLVSLGEPIDPKHWIEALQTSGRYTKAGAARQLGKAKTPAAVAALCKALKDDDAEVRIAVAKALGEAADPEGVEPLIAALSDRHNLNVGYAAGSALGKIGRPAIQALMKQFGEFDERAQAVAPIAIREAEAETIMDLLRQCLTSKHWPLRDAATRALAKLKTPDGESLKVAKRMIADPHWNVRWTAADCLRELATPETAADIRAILLKVVATDASAKVRRAGLGALYYLPGKPPADFWLAIKAALGDEAPPVREKALSTAHKFWDDRLTPTVLALLSDTNAGVRSTAAVVCGARGIEAAEPRLIDMLGEDEDLHCASRAAIALARMGSDRAIAALAAQSQDAKAPDKRRDVAIQGLCYTTNPLAIDPLIEGLAFKPSRHRIRVHRALVDLTGQDFKYNAAKWRQWRRQTNAGHKDDPAANPP